MAGALERDKRYVRRPFNAPLDESLSPDRNPGLVQAQNVVYRRFATVAKRTGTLPYGASFTSSAVISGVRWYRGLPSMLKQMIVQANDQLWVGNDSTGVFTSIGSLAAGSTPAFFASSYDPLSNGGAGGDILIIAYGSGAPLKWDGTTLSALNGSITNHFAGCTSWHDHVWFWGDPANPDTVFATDIDAPESYAFSLAQGGYPVGRGDGDATVQVCVGVGAGLYIFKDSSIYAITGFDFYTGNYQFQLSPVVSGIGTSAPHSVAVLRNAIIWWSGQTVYRLPFGATQPEVLGIPIVKTSAAVAQQPQGIIRAVAGDFLVQTAGGFSNYTGHYYCAVSAGSGVADTVLCYDDDASQFFGRPAWSTLTGFTVGCFIPWGGPGDQQLLYIGDGSGGGIVNLWGGNPSADNATAIAVALKTGRDNGGSDESKKHLSALYIDLEANAVSLAVSIISDLLSSNTSTQTFTPDTTVGVVGSAVVGIATVGPAISTLFQTAEAAVSPSLDGHNFQFILTEASTTSVYELVSLAYLIQEETLVR